MCAGTNFDAGRCRMAADDRLDDDVDLAKLVLVELLLPRRILESRSSSDREALLFVFKVSTAATFWFCLMPSSTCCSCFFTETTLRFRWKRARVRSAFFKALSTNANSSGKIVGTGSTSASPKVCSTKICFGSFHVL